MTEQSVGPPRAMTQPSVPADWYPDPGEPATLRYWDGQSWTDHRSALVPTVTSAPVGSTDFSPAPIAYALIGSALAIVGSFLPQLSAELTIIDNTLVKNLDGIAIIVISVLASTFAITRRTGFGRNIGVLLAGVAILGLVGYDAFNPHLINGLGQQVDSSPGVGIYVTGLGGLLLVVAGLSDRDMGPV